MSTQIMSGARAKIGFIGTDGRPVFVGIFNNVSYGFAVDAQPAYILGRFSAADSDYVSQEVVNISANGFRVIDNGAHVAGQVPTVNELLNHEYLTMVIIDRKDPTKSIATFRKVRPTGYSTSISARNLEEISMTFLALTVDDETSGNGNVEGGDISNLP